MDCREIFEALSDFIDSDLSDRTCVEIEAHLDNCSNCRIVVSTLRKTITLYHSMPRMEMPGDVRLRLHKVIQMDPEED